MPTSDTSSKMASFRGEEVVDLLDEKLYVAVSKDLKACKSTILWALQNSGGKRVRLLHVHQPAQTISILGARFPVSSLSEQEVRLHREKERRDMCKMLDEYLCICAKSGAQAEKLYIEMDIIEYGIVELISQHKIGRLVMGAAADNRYSRKMLEPKSKKANYVREHAPAFCHIWFICKGRLIYTREGNTQLHLHDDNESGPATAKSRVTQSTSGWSSPISRAGSASSLDDFDRSSTFSLSPYSGFPRPSAAASDSISASFSRNEERDVSSRSLALPPRPEEKQHQSLSLDVVDGKMNDVLYEQLDQAISEAEMAKREAFQESMKRRRAEKEAIDATRKAKAAESLYFGELRRREEIEDELAKAREELEAAKSQRDMALEELRVVLDQKLLIEKRVEKSDAMEKDLEDKIISALDLLRNYKKQ